MKDLIICLGIGMNMFFPVYLVIPAEIKIKAKNIIEGGDVKVRRGHCKVELTRTQNK